RKIMEKLTKRQNDVLNFVKSYIVSHGYPPTVREIGKALNTSSPATIHAHLNNLEKKGFIRKDNSKNRYKYCYYDKSYYSYIKCFFF
ncbi:MAG: BlaI/MecI/CopY family transcriptional regulator, partial [Mycoplasmataceae bacterium]|nr:BlaI/MecI/CopY family transcriptional regulator [Mycoplasmataceae bacterium]